MDTGTLEVVELDVDLDSEIPCSYCSALAEFRHSSLCKFEIKNAKYFFCEMHKEMWDSLSERNLGGTCSWYKI